MRSRSVVSLCLLLVFAVAAASHAELIEHLFDDPEDRAVSPYICDVGPIEVADHSLVEIYVQNVLASDRYKEWSFTVWLPDGETISAMLVDYDNTPLHSDPIEFFAVPLAELVGDNTIAGYTAFYASTYETPWENDGTTPVGTAGDHPWGNPGWVSYHVDIPDTILDGTPIYYSIYDECLPEPATLGLLGLGGLMLRRRKR